MIWRAQRAAQPSALSTCGGREVAAIDLYVGDVGMEVGWGEDDGDGIELSFSVACSMAGFKLVIALLHSESEMKHRSAASSSLSAAIKAFSFLSSRSLSIILRSSSIFLRVLSSDSDAESTFVIWGAMALMKLLTRCGMRSLEICWETVSAISQTACFFNRKATAQIAITTGSGVAGEICVI